MLACTDLDVALDVAYRLRQGPAPHPHVQPFARVSRPTRENDLIIWRGRVWRCALWSWTPLGDRRAVNLSLSGSPRRKELYAQNRRVHPVRRDTVRRLLGR